MAPLGRRAFLGPKKKVAEKQKPRPLRHAGSESAGLAQFFKVPGRENCRNRTGAVDMKYFKAGIVAVLFLAPGMSPANADPLKNIVLVHGAWVDASGWKPIYEILTKDGFNVTMVQEPETSFADDVAASWGIVAASDKIINPDLERWYYARAKSRTTEIKGASHAVYESHPGEVAAAIANAPRNAQNARSVRK